MLSLFFVDELATGQTQELSGDEGHHAVSVMRMKVGEQIKIADNSGNWVSGAITEVNKKSLKIDVSSRGSTQPVLAVDARGFQESHYQKGFPLRVRCPSAC